MIESGVLSSTSIGRVITRPMSMVARETMAHKEMQFPITTESCSRSFAPKRCATKMPTPVDTPTNRASSRFKIGEALPTAAKALSPT